MRSANSIANGQQPLILLDGIYLNGSSLADINPEDIEKVEVLKGAAGASLFGSQAANGVI
ncbi:TonB-dependent receptor plug domain-containing protein, partial [Okeania hirsuta]|uniref:TonB-dependent receptor plug domain-containing protein n=1 Tax=Okeania hirsuta TaxID=1458930 RepID=UPI0035C903A2